MKNINECTVIIVNLGLNLRVNPTKLVVEEKPIGGFFAVYFEKYRIRQDARPVY